MLSRRLLAEFTGTALLLIAIVGSGIGASNLSPNETGLILFENALATGAALLVLILVFEGISGAHLNPVITLADRLLDRSSMKDACAYVAAQILGASVGVILANLMFELPAITISDHSRWGYGVWLGEVIATFGLVLVVFGLLAAGKTRLVAFAVGIYVAAAVISTSSTSFANPAVTVGRMFSDTFTGIAPSSVPAFVVAQVLGGLAAFGIVRLLYPTR